MGLLNFDVIESWESQLRELLVAELPPNFDAALIASKPRHVEDARDTLLALGDRRHVLAKVTSWLQSQAMVGYHGSRLSPDEIIGIKRDGIRALAAADRADRISRGLSPHPNWPEVRATLADALRLYGPGNRGGRREGQVHLTLSRSALIRGFNHYLVEGSEFDGHVAQYVLGCEGRQMMRNCGEPVVFEIHVPAGQAFDACNPYGVREDEPPTLVRAVLAVWSYRVANPGYKFEESLIDYTMTFKGSLPAAWINEVAYLQDAELLPHYRP